MAWLRSYDSQGRLLPYGREAARQARREKEQAEREADQQRQAKERAEREAEQERLRAERLAQQLRALGMEPEDLIPRTARRR